MPDGVAAEDKRLQDVLRSLAAESAEITEYGRRISGQGGAIGLTAILREIEETVLPRRLIFTGNAGMQLNLLVAERRILHIGAKADDVSDTEGADVAARLQAFCTAVTEVHVCCELSDHGSAKGIAGLSPSDLAPFLSADADVAKPPVPVETALAESESYALALCDAASGSDVRLKGQDSICARLQRLEENPAAGAENGGNSTPGCQVWMGDQSDPFAILLVTLPRRRIWLAFEPEHLDACIACWSGAV
ncbi:hypothetical protein [uncultured Roseobacter sp.]|uniref:hypothetical protein n=1 Tax=uncultured Roseobacter sp. TaxID=114847 RepID=UPI0026039FB2|nr:hypothetical protein [uncultured Roseobacter sp.]